MRLGVKHSGSLLLLTIATLAAQSTDEADWQKAAAGKMAFEVASVKPSKVFRPPNYPLDQGNAKTPGGRFRLTTYISFAYRLGANPEQGQIFRHLPDSVNKDFYDIEAKAPGNPTKDRIRLMVQSLLAERFKLAAHFETREVPVLALTLVKPGEAGPKLRPHAEGPACPESVTNDDGPRTSGKVEDVFPPRCETTEMRLTPLNANPLDDIGNSRKIDKVFLRGQELDRAALKAKWQARWPQTEAKKSAAN